MIVERGVMVDRPPAFERRMVREDSIVETMLFRDRDDGSPADGRISYPQSALLVDCHLMRSTAFAPSRQKVSALDEFVCRQVPASRGLCLLQPNGPLTVRDALLYGEITRLYRHSCEREDRIVSMSLAKAAVAMGYCSRGGQQRRLARQSLERLTATTLCWKEAREDHTVHELYWHLLDSVSMCRDRDDRGGTFLELSRISAELVDSGYLHYLNSDLCRRLVVADEIAARLWMALECERLRQPFHYRVFRTPLGAEPQPSDAMIISELIGLDCWRNRRVAVHRLRGALKVIASIDTGRYEFELYLSKAAGMYTLRVRRHQRVRRLRG